MLPLQIKQKHHCSNYSDLKASRSHFFSRFLLVTVLGQTKEKSLYH